MSTGSRQILLSYILQPKRKQPRPITLDLYEAESYASAVIVQQLVGTLVYFSNQGRYEPRIAKSWRRETPTKWVFELNEGYACENGEIITADKFKASLERTIRHLSAKQPLPIFSRLIGFHDFLEKRSNLGGIVAKGRNLEFVFEGPIKSGLVEFLSFAPFGYICRDNLNENGDWGDPKRFISSGPYKISSIEIGKEYVLQRRNEWPAFSKSAPDQIKISHELSNSNSPGPTIIDSDIEIESLGSRFEKYDLVPEYLNAVVLGNFKSGFFGDIKNRLDLRTSLEVAKGLFPRNWNGYARSAKFFSSQEDKFVEDKILKTSINLPSAPILIEGKEPKTGIIGNYTWPILKRALTELRWPYKFAENESTWAEVTSPKYDIRMRSPSIGGGFEAWGVSNLFCSKLGSGLPDPSGIICKLIEKYECSV